MPDLLQILSTISYYSIPAVSCIVTLISAICFLLCIYAGLFRCRCIQNKALRIMYRTGMLLASIFCLEAFMAASDMVIKFLSFLILMGSI